jgi:hypothetical protein
MKVQAIPAGSTKSAVNFLESIANHNAQVEGQKNDKLAALIAV